MTGPLVIKNFNKDAFLSGIQMGFETWFEPLLPILQTLYFRELAKKITNEYYKADFIYSIFPPKREQVFKAFQSTPWDDLKIVIVGREPYAHSGATGLAFANPDHKSKYPTPDLSTILDCVERKFYDGLNINKDVTLESWAEQGVLLLNVALTTGSGGKNHINWWQPFTQRVIETISNRKEGVIFMLWGTIAKDLMGWIDTKKHHVLVAPHPLNAYYQDVMWDCLNFETANTILQERGEKLIKW